jgi:hypothetical protein
MKFFGEFQGGFPHIKTKETFINELSEMSVFLNLIEMLYSIINTLTI